jgi:two-component system, sensor histidine kinase and response regulator
VSASGSLALGLEEIAGDPAEQERERRRGDRQYHAHTVPRHRLTGMLMLAAVVALHNVFILRAFSLRGYLALLSLLVAYCAISWAILARFYEGDRPVTLGDVFLVADIGVFAVAIYASGGERSWLLPVLTARVADQAYTSFRRARFFAHATVAAYSLLLTYLFYVEHRLLDVQAEIAKIGMLYAVNMYVAFTARTAERLRGRSAEAVDLARSLIAELRTSKQRLEEERTRAEEASAFKSAFLANMSHEVRTPLNGILGMAGLALDGELSSEVRDQLETIQASARALLRIVNDVLDFSRIEAGRLDFEDAPFDLRDWLADVIRSTEPLARAKGLEFACSVEPSLPDALLGDAGRLRQVLVNLIGNAVKFTAAGSVAVEVTPDHADEHGLTVRFAVRDTGIGVPPDKRAAIFEAFTQADGSLTRRYGGTGLGLAISSRLVAQMAGRLWLESPPSGGSVFQFTARLQKGARPAQVAVDPRAARGQRVLVSAEDPGAAERWRDVLGTVGFEVTTAAFGRPAFMALERFHGAGHPFRVVVLDTDGQDIDVMAVAGKVFAGPSFGGPDVLAVVNAGERGDAARASEMGVAAYLRKPVSDQDVVQAALRALSVGTRQGQDGPAPLVPRRPLRILLAEDNEVNVKVASRLLQRWGHEVVVACDGPSALERLEDGAFDLALLDVQMPGMTGLEVARRVREVERESGSPPLPMLAVTAHALGTDRERSFAVGMTGYVTKPIDPGELFAAIEHQVGAAPTAAARRSPAPPTPLMGQAFDPLVALERAGGDAAFMRELCQIMLGDLERLPGELRDAVLGGDAHAAEMAAHQLKGNCATFAAEPARAAAEAMEEAAHRGDLQAMAAGLDRVVREVVRLQEALGAQLALR